MLAALNKTFHWPGLQVTFYFEGRLFAVLNASKAGKDWFALPHSDSFGFQLTDTASQVPERNVLIELIQGLIRSQALYEGAETGIHSKSVELSDTTQVREISHSEQVTNLSIRSLIPLLSHNEPVKVVSLIDLTGGMGAVMQRFSSNVRRKIRKSASNGIVVTEGGPELIDDFYKIYRTGIHRHGSFGLTKTFFINLLNESNSLPGPKARLFIACLGKKPVGSALLLSQLGFSENNAFATLPRFNHLYTSYALHHAMISYSVERGISQYSLGRSTPGSGINKFKQQFGGIELPLYYSSQRKETGIQIPFKWVSPVIKALPVKAVRYFDGFVAGKVY